MSPEMPCAGLCGLSCRLLFLSCLLAILISSSAAPVLKTPDRRTKRSAGNEFFFVKVPLENPVRSGRSVRLRCKVNKKKDIRYNWEHNNSPLRPTTRRFQVDSDLFINNADPELDQGYFHCIATNTTSGYSRRSSPYSLKILWIRASAEVKLIQPERLSDVRGGAPVVLRCVTRASPAVQKQQIEWFHNFQRLRGTPAEQKRCEILSNGDLRMKSYATGNAGVYRCRVSHGGGVVLSDTPMAISANDESSLFTAASDPKKYVKYFRHSADLRIRCPLQMKKNAVGFITWSYRSQLGPKSAVRSFHLIGRSCVTETDCVLPKDDFFDLRRRPAGTQRAGFYMCQLHFVNNSNSMPYVLDVRRARNPPLNASNFALRSPLENIVPMAGRSFTLRVYLDSAASSPSPTFKWILPNGEVVDLSTSGSSRVRLQKGGSLYFETVLPSDSGVYKLQKSNLASTQQIDIRVAVAFLPKLTAAAMPDVTWQEGPRNATLRCNVASKAVYPVAKVLWLKDGKKLDELTVSPLSFLRADRDGRLSYSSTSISIPAPTRTRLVVNQRAGLAAFHSVTASDAGIYQCFVQSDGFATVKSNPFRVTVLRQLRILVNDPQPFLERGVPGKLMCIAKGEGPLSFSWLRRDAKSGRMVEIRGGRMTSRQNLPGKMELDIALVKDEDAGEYMCKVLDRLGASGNTTYRVVVGEKPTIKEWTRSNVTALAGETVRLECTAAGDPAPKTSWIRRRPGRETESLTLDNYVGVDVRRAHQVLFENGTLVIRNVVYEDSGVYQCVVGHKHGMISGPDIHVKITPRNGATGDEFRRRSPLTKTILIVVGCALAYLGLIIALTVYCSLRMVRKRRKYTEAALPGSKAEMAAENQRLMTNNNVRIVHNSPSASQYSRSAAVDSNIPVYPRGRLITTACLGKGEFGEVLVARAPVVGCGAEPEVLVTVSTLQSAKDRHLAASFHEKMEMFHKFDHRSVARLVGACLDSEPRCFLLEFCAWGDLKQFLRTIRSGQQKSAAPFLLPNGSVARGLSPAQRMHICAQVANGMEHISNLRFVHKDLAARNVLIAPSFDVKVSHLALSHSIYAEDYFPMRLPGWTTSRPFPLRWMPPEVILNGAYGPETDVWSFAIFAYEVLTSGETPLRKHSHAEILTAAAAGHLFPELPPSCAPDLQRLLLRCWSALPAERPSFSEISVLVGGMAAECDI